VRAGGSPAIARSVGATNSSNESCALTGLPGKPITGMPRYAPVACGPPGCMATLPTHPPNGSRVSRTTS